MATAEQRQTAIDKVTDELLELAAIDGKGLARTSDLSHDINFKDAVPHFEEMIDLCKQLSQRDISRLTTPQLSAVLAGLAILSKLVQRVLDFDLNQNTPKDVCQGIINEVINAYDDVMNPLLLPLSFTATQATDYAKIEREAKGYHTTMSSEAKKLSEFIDNARLEAQQALEAVKDQAAEAGVSTNAQIFIGDSLKHGIAAKTWLIATIVMSSVTLIVAVAALVTAFLYTPEGLAATVQYIVSKLLVLSTLSFGIFWCARNYKSQKHNETLNKHRANALMTFRAFVEGTSDARVKDAILLQAAQAAFSGRPTGFDASDNDTQVVNPVIELLGKSASQSS